MILTNAAPAQSLLSRLSTVANTRGLAAMAGRLSELSRWVALEMADFERELTVLPRGARVVQRSAHHLIDLGGKHLRPMCVALSSKLGSGFDEVGRRLALAVELVHSATLLHDDVIDMAATRRGAPAARMVYGNAASIFAGDWLLVEALRQIRRAGVEGLLDEMLAIIDEMILAESVQLEHRGEINGSRSDYFRVVEGKTAALFRWSMRAGARVGGLTDAECDALERYGLHLGVAFQAVDDVLDVDGDIEATGKQLFTDLREGKTTYPLILALERDPQLFGILADCARGLSPSAVHAVLESLRQTEAVIDCRRFAAEEAAAAIACLDRFGDSEAVRALVTVAEVSVVREA